MTHLSPVDGGHPEGSRTRCDEEEGRRANGPAPTQVGCGYTGEGWRDGEDRFWNKSIYFTVWWGLIQPFSALLQRYRLNLLKNKRRYILSHPALSV